MLIFLAEKCKELLHWQKMVVILHTVGLKCNDLLTDNVVSFQNMGPISLCAFYASSCKPFYTC